MSVIVADSRDEGVDTGCLYLCRSCSDVSCRSVQHLGQPTVPAPSELQVIENMTAKRRRGASFLFFIKMKILKAP